MLFLSLKEEQVSLLPVFTVSAVTKPSANSHSVPRTVRNFQPRTRALARRDVPFELVNDAYKLLTYSVL